jgi:hypothetical protein
MLRFAAPGFTYSYGPDTEDPSREDLCLARSKERRYPPLVRLCMLVIRDSDLNATDEFDRLPDDVQDAFYRFRKENPNPKTGRLDLIIIIIIRIQSLL